MKPKETKQTFPVHTEKTPNEKIIKAYQVFKSLMKTAQVLEMDYREVEKVLVRNNISLPDYSRPLTGGNKKYSSFAKWIRKNPNTPLPRSIKGMVEITGCSYDTIRCYLYRRRSEIKKLLKKAPDLRNVNAYMEDIFGNLFCTGEFREYRYEIDNYSMAITLHAKLSDITKTVFIITDVKRFLSQISHELTG